MGRVYHSLVLDLHQPSGNLEEMLVSNEWAAREILFALDRVPGSLWAYEDVNARARTPHDTASHGELAEAHWRLLRAETSCNLYWGERCHHDLDAVQARLQALESSDRDIGHAPAMSYG